MIKESDAIEVLNLNTGTLNRLKNNGVFIMNSSTVVIRKNELLATHNTLISLEENDIYLSRYLNSPTGLRIKNIICGWLNVN